MHSRNVKRIVLGVVLLVALPVVAFAQTSRVEGMSIQGDYIKDYTAIYTYPSAITNVGNLVYGELGVAVGGTPADRAIGGGKDGRLGREVRKALSALHYQIGAAQAGSDDSLPQAAAHLRAAVQDDPSNDAASSQLRQIADRAKEIYLRGYVAKDDDAESARRAFKLVIETLPSSDETAQKAKRWLDKLDGKVSKEE